MSPLIFLFDRLDIHSSLSLSFSPYISTYIGLSCQSVLNQTKGYLHDSLEKSQPLLPWPSQYIKTRMGNQFSSFSIQSLKRTVLDQFCGIRKQDEFRFWELPTGPSCFRILYLLPREISRDIQATSGSLKVFST